jgi:histidinol-phosphate/aromatic aminotransferase/cobyric acid decarboxylase-like protein/N-acyl-L-homoserine lactone synthetase
MTIRISFHRTEIREASDEHRNEIHRARHRVYADELKQHRPNAEGRLRDALDDFNHYLVALRDGELAGFVSITPPGGPGYSIDKYFRREDLPFEVDQGLYEIRLLTVLEEHRRSEIAAGLMLAAFRWVEARAGTRIVAIGRREVVGMYLKGGLRATGQTVQAGEVTYDLLHATVASIRAHADAWPELIAKIERTTDWQLAIPLRKPAACFHGGAFFDAVGVSFDTLERKDTVINADVLDAWFPPAPGVVEALTEHLPWLLRTSPPAGCEGLIDAIARARGIPTSTILPGAGSSDLIFRALPKWLRRGSRVILLDPTYGEYAHVLGKVIGCHIDRLELSRANNYAVNVKALRDAVASGPDLVVLVNPNSPTGRFLHRAEMQEILSAAPGRTRIWVDETYIDYVGSDETLEPLVSRHDNLIVCKSMSKVYALSGARAAYLCAGPHQLEELRAITPPWAVSLTAQVAAVKALADPGYYETRWAETNELREHLEVELEALGWDVVPGCANFLLAHLPDELPSAAELVSRCRKAGLYLRDASVMGTALGSRAIRVAVKDGATNQRIVGILSQMA